MSTLDWDEFTELAKALEKRADFQLSYHKSKVKRKIHVDGITGESIDDAYNPGEKSPGDWENGGKYYSFVDNKMPADEAEDFIFATMFDSAINEAVHEALEWFTIDGERPLDPHGAHETAIYKLVENFAAQLWDLSKSNPSRKVKA